MLRAAFGPSTVSSDPLGAGRVDADRLSGLLLLGHFPIACLLAALYGDWPLALAIGAPLSAVALAVTWLRPGMSSTRILVSVAYMLYSALFIQLGHGLTELHFHVFAAMALLLVYRDWRLPLIAATAIAVHHTLFLYAQQTMPGVHVMPDAEAGIAGWYMWSVHIVFVLVESAILASMAWRLAVEAEQTREIFKSLGELGWQGRENAPESNVADAQRSVVNAIHALEACSLELEAAVLEQRAIALPPSDALYGAFLTVDGQMRRAAQCVEMLRVEADESSERLRESNRVLAEEIDRASALTERAEAATLAKSAFLANMSHEIRTPLTAILGYADIVRSESCGEDPLSPRAIAVDTIERAGEHLLALINDILDLSKLESGKLIVEHVDASLAHVLVDVDRLMQARATAKGIALETRIVTPIPDRIRTDPTRLRQILLNLTANAVKFIEAGRIEILASVGVRDARDVLRMAVTDTGPGISHEQADRLFEPFTQADTSVTRRHGGTGLGLSISQRLAELLGGDVRLEWTGRGVGSRFTLEIPLTPVPGCGMLSSFEDCTRQRSSHLPPRGDVKAPRLSGRILLAEDGEDNQRLIAFHLRTSGADVTVAENGRIALALLDARQHTSAPFDLLVADMQMSELDGYNLARAVRERRWPIPVIALTAYAMPEDRQRCIDAGCDDYAAKPIHRLELLRTCRRWMSDTPVSENVFPIDAADLGYAECDRPPEETRMLASQFEDDPMMRELISDFLRRLAVRVDALHTDWRARELDRMSVEVHRLKGAASGYGFPTIGEAASRLQSCLRDDDGGVNGSSALEALSALCQAAIRHELARA